jgi:glycine cleavage system H protein
MKLPKDLLYTEEHEWVQVENGIATVGITDYAQGELGDIVYIELPELNLETKQMEPFGTIEAVKAVSDLFAPVSGNIIEINAALQEKPEIINHDPYGEGWMVKIKMSNPSEADSLLSVEDYKEKIS